MRTAGRKAVQEPSVIKSSKDQRPYKWIGVERSGKSRSSRKKERIGCRWGSRQSFGHLLKTGCKPKSQDRMPRTAGGFIAHGVAMPSPFPGMDPYLESPTHWSDFHFEM